MMRIRLPDGVKATLKAYAEENRRSMNAEIVERKEQALKTIQASPTIKIETLLIGMQSEIDNLKERVTALEVKI